MTPFAFWNSGSSSGGGGGGGGITCYVISSTQTSPWNATTVRNDLHTKIDAESGLTADQKTAMKQTVTSYVSTATVNATVVYKTVNSVSYDITIESLPLDESAVVAYPSSCYP
jgi:hypothetical protein